MSVKIVKISGNDETLGTWELQRLPAKEETITIKNRSYRVINIETVIDVLQEQYVLYVA